MTIINPLTAIDFYKADHKSQYPEGTEYVYSTWTPRSDKLANVLPEYWDGKIVWFGLQGFIKSFLINDWNEGFFNKNKEEVVAKYKRRMDNALGKDSIDVTHIEELHDLGYLPLRIKSLPEGSRVDIKIPPMTMVNTNPKFFWLTNYLESVLSSELWKSCTTATIAGQYDTILKRYATETGVDEQSVAVQCHDFAFRGMSGMHDAAKSGAGHLLFFIGTDGVLSIDYLEDYYNANSDLEMVGCSVPATEHSVMCMGTQDNEIGTFKRLINETYPTGIVSIVSDTWDYWKVICEYLPLLKADICKRGRNELGLSKVVIRPDSGDPVKIICGDPESDLEHIRKGTIECMWDVFGGTETSKGYKVLNEHIGLIYGDSITLERADTILRILKEKGFASSNIVLGVGSYTYQYNTRDTFGFAMKATWGVVNGEHREIFKDPATDNGTKKSAKGLVRVDLDSNGNYILTDQCELVEEKAGLLVDVFVNGQLIIDQSLGDIRKRLSK